MSDYEVREVPKHRVKVEGKGSHTIIPAQPGFSTVSRLTDGNDKTLGLEYDPVIAWLITTEVWALPPERRRDPDYLGDDAERMCHPLPITAVGTQGDGYQSWRVIRFPSGKFYFPDGTYVDDEAAAIELMDEQAAEEQAARLSADNKIN
jgi:hypothetical protein